MAIPEDIEQVLEAAIFGIVLNSNDLVVSRRARTDILVTRIVDEAMAIPNLGLRHTRDPLVS